MTKQEMARKVEVVIVSAKAEINPPSWEIEYSVHNHTPAMLWLVVEESLVLKRDGARIELSYSRGRMQPGVQVFGYFVPTVIDLPPGRAVSQSVQIGWPCRLNDIWNSEREVALPPGQYEVSVRVGFASTPAPPPPEVGEDVEAPVLRWQEEAASSPVRIELPSTATH
jgi:hypothetical protein